MIKTEALASGFPLAEHSEANMANEKIALMAHLYRRAGFGATATSSNGRPSALTTT